MGLPRLMKLLFDQNLSFKLVALLATHFPDSAHVGALGMVSATDPIVWEYAKTNNFIIVPKDTDFQQRALLYGHPPKVIWVRFGNCTTACVATVLRSRVAEIAEFTADAVGSFLVLP